MDTGEILVQFMNLTGTDVEFAQSFLETNGWDLDLCVNLYLEGGAQPHQPSAQGTSSIPNGVDLPYEGSLPPPPQNDDYFEPEVRAPIMPRQEVLVEEDPYEVYVRRRAMQRAGFHNNTSKGVFEMFRDFNQEGRAPIKTDLSGTENKKLKTLADLFRPPLELIETGSFEDVKNKAFARKKWLLVNIQTITEFDCQRLNRDTWSDPVLKSIVGEGFVLWQVLRENEEGGRYCRFYPVETLPHIAIIDSRTGERVETWEGFIDATKLRNELTKFLETHFFDDAEAVSKTKVIDSKRKGDEFEEEQLMAAIAASLGSNPSEQEVIDAPMQPATIYAPPPTIVTIPTIATPTTTTTTTIAPEPAPTISASAPAPVPTPSPSETIDPTIKEEHANPSPECTCTIQIRLPSGPIKGHFRPTDTLSLVHKYTALHLEPGASFTLCSSFPKRSFSGDLLSQTLQQAGPTTPLTSY